MSHHGLLNLEALTMSQSTMSTFLVPTLTKRKYKGVIMFVTRPIVGVSYLRARSSTPSSIFLPPLLIRASVESRL